MNTQKEEYVTLFCEGDGSTFIDGNGYLRVSFGQKERDILDYVASITKNGHINRHGDNAWELTFNGSYCLYLLEVFSRHVVGKKFLDRLNEVLEYMGMPLAVQHPLTFDGFIGFWDADGSSDNQPKITASQLDREILDLICGVLGGNVTPCRNQKGSWYYKWQLGSDEARELYGVVLGKSHHPSRAKRLRQNFEGPSYYDLHKDERHTYYELHEDKIKAHNNAYNDTHRDVMRPQQQAYRDVHKVEKKVHDRTYNKKRDAERKAIREWMETHPEEVVRLQESS